MLKKQLFLITIFYSLALGLVCLLPLKKIPNMGVSFADKIFHSLIYVVLVFLWFGTFFFQLKKSKIKAIVYASVISIVFGIIIEVLQEVFTTTRQADIFDVLANSLGVLVAASLLLLKKQKYS